MEEGRKGERRGGSEEQKRGAEEKKRRYGDRYKRVPLVISCISAAFLALKTIPFFVFWSLNSSSTLF